MKKLTALLLSLVLALSVVACGGADKADVKSEGVMTHAEYMAAALESEVVIEAYVQAKQGWWDNTATVYLQDKEGAYFAYNMACTEEEYAKIPTGTKIKVTGYKAEWSGEVEIIDAQESADLTKKYNVTKAPTMFVTDKAGNTIKLENISDIKKYIEGNI